MKDKQLKRRDIKIIDSISYVKDPLYFSKGVGMLQIG